ncbi:MAG: glucokinase [Candidatus Melainabacteria bacterium HGW-Melainabacteria-1]|nr:MAG: glucokinase [Candidatus Melainabacteria bacterium HGW-Melainabacteria-1]
MSQSCQIGFDVGGTTLKAALVSGGEILETVSATTPVEQSQAEAILVISALIERLKDAARRQQLELSAVGMGIAGLVDHTRGYVITAPNLPTWCDFSLAEQLSRKVGLPVALDNDVRTMAMGELAYGAGQGAVHMLCLTVGTGVGSAIVIDGQIYRGASLTAGEFGHVTVVPAGGRTCGCGNRGCLETVAGTEGILSLAERQLERGLAPILAQKLAENSGHLSPKLIAESASAGDAGCIALWQEVGHWLGLALAGAVNFINPERIVIGGGIAQAGSLLFDPIERAIRLHAFERPARAVRVMPAQLGASAGMIGSAVLAQHYSQKEA